MLKVTVGLFLLTVLSQGLLSAGQFDDDQVLFNGDEGVTQPALQHMPDIGEWYVQQNKSYCIKLHVGVRFNFTYTDKNDKNMTTEFDLLSSDYTPPYNTTNSTGNCGQDQKIVISFFDETWKLEVDFKSDDSNRSYHISGLSLVYELVKDQLPIQDIMSDVNGTAAVTLNELSTSKGRSYECESRLLFSFPDDTFVNYISFQQLHMEAYATTNSTKFSQSSTCPQDQVSNIVPIAVGAALGALVLIVLIAYLIGRRKSSRGYESV